MNSQSSSATPAAASTSSSHATKIKRSLTCSKRKTKILPEGGKGHVKKKRRMSSFQAEWKTLFDWVMESNRGQEFALCKLCNSNINIGYRGRPDLQRHINSEKHKANLKHVAPESKVPEIFPIQAKQSSSVLKVVKAEVAFVTLLAEHSLPFTTGDHLLKYIKKYCNDPEVVKKMNCGGTMTACSVEHSVDSRPQEDVAAVCQKQPFCIYLDQSTDIGDNKLLVILAGFFDQARSRNVVQFLDMPVCVTGTGEAIYNCLIKTLQRFNIPTSNVAAYSSDNAVVMVGKRNSVLSRLKKLNPNIFSVGHLGHIADLCIESGVKAMTSPIEDLISDMYCHFSSSAWQQQKLKEFALFVDIEPLAVIHPDATCWLSLSTVIRRMLDLWPALLSYFQSYEPRSQNIDLITERLKNHEVKLVFLFLKYATEPLLKFSVQLQAKDSPLISLYSDVIKLLQTYANRLLKPPAAKEFLENICVSSNSVLEDENNIMQQISVGPDVATYLDEHGEDIAGTVTEHTFYKKIKAFYVVVLQKMKNNLPVSDPVLQNIGSLLDPSLKLQLSSTVVASIGTRLGFCNSKVECFRLIDEFALYQISDFKWVQHPGHNSKTYACFLKYWSTVLQSHVIEEMPVFKRLMLTLLCLPHLNNEPERAFSMVQKVKTELRQSLNVKTLNALLAIKMNEDNNCSSVVQQTAIL